MYKVPFVFRTVPDELWTDDFIEDTLLMKIVREILQKVRPFPRTEQITTNRHTENITLDPFHFIYRRKAWAKKFNVSESAIRRRMDKLYNINYAQRIKEEEELEKTSSPTSSSTRSPTSSSTSTYSICRLCVERFRQQKQDLEDQQFDTQFDTQSDTKSDHNIYKKASIEAKEVKEGSSNAEIVAIHEAWKFDPTLRPQCLEILQNHSIHYQTCDTTDPKQSDLNFAAAAISFCLGNQKFSFDVPYLRIHRELGTPLEKVVLGIHVLYQKSEREKIDNPEGLLRTICKTQNFQKLRILPETAEMEVCDDLLKQKIAN